MKKAVIIIGALVLAVSCSPSGPTGENNEDAAEIGSSLSDKSDIDIADLPPDVLAVAQAARPDVNFTEAETERRNGVTYYDVGGVDESGAEIELDIMQYGDSWRVVEVQRDISFAETPEVVRAALLARVPDASPDRIIESGQTNGVIVYEFFIRSEAGEETKFEVKLENGEAEFLEEEWAH